MRRGMDACGTPGVALSRDCGTDVEAWLHYVQGVLSKLSAAKELMKEILAREKKKTAEREAAKVPPPRRVPGACICIYRIA